MSVSPDAVASFADGGVFVDPFGGIDYAPHSSRQHTALSPLCPRLSLIHICIYLIDMYDYIYIIIIILIIN